MMSYDPLRRCDDAIVEFYLASNRFNGIPASNLTNLLKGDSDDLDRVLTQLVQENRVSLTFGKRHPNRNIKAFEPESTEVQLSKLSTYGAQSACVYPTPNRLLEVVDQDSYAGQPFLLSLALGTPQLTLLSFDLTVLERYRNDPRFHYTTSDVSGQIATRSADESTMPESNQVFLQTFGFSFDQDLNRAVAVFVWYLANLTPEHQAIWKAHQLGDEYKCHPDYQRISAGRFPEGISVFQAFLRELAEINAICRTIGYPTLFRTEFEDDDRPRRFGFLLRPTRQEYHDFVLLLDKLMADNLNHDFFRNDLELTTETEQEDGRIRVRDKGTIMLLEEWLVAMCRMDDPSPLQKIASAFRRTRKVRQRPAHAIEPDEFDQSYLTKQRELMGSSLEALGSIRYILSRHPLACDHEPKYRREDWKVWMY